MALHHLLLFLLLHLIAATAVAATQNQSSADHFISIVKQSFSGDSISRWDDDHLSGARPTCQLPGIACDDAGDVVELDISSWGLSGTLPFGVCSDLPKLRTLRLAQNDLHGGFPAGILNCSSLNELNLSSSGLSGAVPDELSNLRSLRVLDLSDNLFTGVFPIAALINLTGVEVVNFNENPGFDVWRLPPEIAGLTKLRVLILSTTSMRGEIPPWIGNMSSLTDLELSGNFLSGGIPATLGKLRNLRLLELYYNQLAGEIPDELGNLTELVDIDLSVNRLTGAVPEALCRLPRLSVLQLYNNGLTGELPRVIGNSTSLAILSIYRNSLSGEVTPDLGRFSPLMVLELSENRFSGELPKQSCAGGRLLYFLVLGNLFSGGLPENYASCWPLLRFRVNDNLLGGEIPKGIFSLPHVSIIDMGHNRFRGSIPRSIAGAKNLSELFLQSNLISGELPPEMASASNLVRIDISENRLSGAIPIEIGGLSKLNELSLQGNRLDSPIPATLSLLKAINVLNLSGNLLTGEIPESICALLPNSIDFSNNRLSGEVPLPLLKEGRVESVAGNPALCVAGNLVGSRSVLPLCPNPATGLLRRRSKNIWVIGLSTMIFIIGVLFLVKRRIGRKKKTSAVDLDGPGLCSSSSFSSYDVKSFHKLGFDQHEIMEALIDKNIVGHGGSGTVYKIELNGGERVAVKKLWSRNKAKPLSSVSSCASSWSTSTERQPSFMDKEIKSEVETLGSVRHKNIVKLFCCFFSNECNLLLYEYMPNGSLWDALHHGRRFLDWPTRHRIAVGVAQGIAYLHHDLVLPIVHRDIKSSNILLDADFEPKVADFGIAKVLQASGDGHDSYSTVSIAGTCGYLAPEYAYSNKATTKCDVYSFGVVLMELVTGKKPNEPEFGPNGGINRWVESKAAAGKEGAKEVFDKRLLPAPAMSDKLQAAAVSPETTMMMMHGVLRVALRCTCGSPSLRPAMNEVVQLLMEAKQPGGGGGSPPAPAPASKVMRESDPLRTNS